MTIDVWRENLPPTSLHKDDAARFTMAQLNIVYALEADTRGTGIEWVLYYASRAAAEVGAWRDALSRALNVDPDSLPHQNPSATMPDRELLRAAWFELHQADALQRMTRCGGPIDYTLPLMYLHWAEGVFFTLASRYPDEAGRGPKLHRGRESK